MVHLFCNAAAALIRFWQRGQLRIVIEKPGELTELTIQAIPFGHVLASLGRIRHRICKCLRLLLHLGLALFLMLVFERLCGYLSRRQLLGEPLHTRLDDRFR